jgi:hypothetical protein
MAMTWLAAETFSEGWGVRNSGNPGAFDTVTSSIDGNIGAIGPGRYGMVMPNDGTANSLTCDWTTTLPGGADTDDVVWGMWFRIVDFSVDGSAYEIVHMSRDNGIGDRMFRLSAKEDGADSRVYLWNRNTSNASLQGEADVIGRNSPVAFELGEWYCVMVSHQSPQSPMTSRVYVKKGLDVDANGYPTGWTQITDATIAPTGEFTGFWGGYLAANLRFRFGDNNKLLGVVGGMICGKTSENSVTTDFDPTNDVTEYPLAQMPLPATPDNIYVDTVSGSDSNDGMTEDTPLASFDPIPSDYLRYACKIDGTDFDTDPSCTVNIYAPYATPIVQAASLSFIAGSNQVFKAWKSDYWYVRQMVLNEATWTQDGTYDKCWYVPVVSTNSVVFQKQASDSDDADTLIGKVLQPVSEDTLATALTAIQNDAQAGWSWCDGTNLYIRPLGDVNPNTSGDSFMYSNAASVALSFSGSVSVEDCVAFGNARYDNTSAANRNMDGYNLFFGGTANGRCKNCIAVGGSKHAHGSANAQDGNVFEYIDCVGYGALPDNSNTIYVSYSSQSGSATHTYTRCSCPFFSFDWRSNTGTPGNGSSFYTHAVEDGFFDINMVNCDFTGAKTQFNQANNVTITGGHHQALDIWGSNTSITVTGTRFDLMPLSPYGGSPATFNRCGFLLTGHAAYKIEDDWEFNCCVIDATGATGVVALHTRDSALTAALSKCLYILPTDRPIIDEVQETDTVTLSNVAIVTTTGTGHIVFTDFGAGNADLTLADCDGTSSKPTATNSHIVEVVNAQAAINWRAATEYLCGLDGMTAPQAQEAYNITIGNVGGGRTSRLTRVANALARI